MNPAKREKIFQQWQVNNPTPTSELVYHTPFELLISVMLSAQATDTSVNKATRILYQVIHTPQDTLQLGEEGLKKYIQSIGLYNSKTKHIMQTCQLLVTKHQGKVPNTRAALEDLPGVGRKTANVILNTAFGEPTIAVDTHVFRVANRTGITTGKTPLAVEKNLLKVIPKRYRPHAHHWMILHGRYVCTARKPHCSECCIRTWCEYPHKTVTPNTSLPLRHHNE